MGKGAVLELLPLPLGYRDRSAQAEADACFRGQRGSFTACEEYVAGTRATAHAGANRGAFSTTGNGADDRSQGCAAADSDFITGQTIAVDGGNVNT